MEEAGGYADRREDDTMRRRYVRLMVGLSMILMPVLGLVAQEGPVAVSDPSTATETSLLAEWMKNPRFAAAWRLYQAGKAKESYAAFHALFQEEPGHVGINFGLAMTARASGQFSRAAVAFERILMRQPDNDRVRLELALTYHRMNQPDMARMYAEAVLQQNPPDAVRRNVQQLLSQIDKRQSRLNLTARATVGMLYDSNPNTGPSSEFISITPIRFGPLVFDRLQISETSAPRASWGALLSAFVHGTYDVGLPGAWQVMGLAYVSQSILENADDYDTTLMRAMGGVQHIRGQIITQFPLRYDRVWLQGKDFVQIVNAGVTHVRAIDQRTRWTSGASLETRDYQATTVRDNIRAGINQGVRRTVRPGWFVSGGATVFREYARESMYSNVGLEPFVSSTWHVNRSTRLSGRLQYRPTWYDEREPIAPVDRRDRQALVQMEVQHQLNPTYQASLAWQFTDNDSTFKLYDYQRHLVSLNFSGRF